MEVVRGNIKNGIVIPEIKSVQTAIVKLDVTFGLIHGLDKITNLVTVDAPDNLDPSTDDGDMIVVGKPELEVLKEAQDTDGIVESYETIRYTISINNIGDASAYDVFVKDPLSDPSFNDAKISEAVVTINGVEVVRCDIKNGVIIPEIKKGETALVNFDVTFGMIQNNQQVLNLGGFIAKRVRVDPVIFKYLLVEYYELTIEEMYDKDLVDKLYRNYLYFLKNIEEVLTKEIMIIFLSKKLEILDEFNNLKKRLIFSISNDPRSMRVSISNDLNDLLIKNDFNYSIFITYMVKYFFVNITN